MPGVVTAHITLKFAERKSARLGVMRDASFALRSLPGVRSM
jgi:hypothetical protein